MGTLLGACQHPFLGVHGPSVRCGPWKLTTPNPEISTAVNNITSTSAGDVDTREPEGKTWPRNESALTEKGYTKTHISARHRNGDSESGARSPDAGRAFQGAVDCRITHVRAKQGKGDHVKKGTSSHQQWVCYHLSLRDLMARFGQPLRPRTLLGQHTTS